MGEGALWLVVEDVQDMSMPYCFFLNFCYWSPVTFLHLFSDPVQKVCLGVSDLQRSTRYWTTLLGMKVIDKNEEKKTVLLGFSDTQVSQIWNK